MLRQFAADLKHALRVWAKTPTVTLAAVITLAMGVGLNGALFGLLDAVWLRRLPVNDAERIVVVHNDLPSIERIKARLSALQFSELAARTDLFESTAAVLSTSGNVTSDADPERFQVRRVSPKFFQVMRVRPIRGRAFSEADVDGRAQSVVISETFWRSRLGERDDVLGQVVTIDSRPYEVVGVVPLQFELLYPDVHVWLPYTPSQNLLAERYRWDLCCDMVARLRPTVSIESARKALAINDTGFASDFPGFRTRLTPIREEFAGTTRQPIILLVVAGLVVLAITCVNITNLLLLRAAARTREFAMRRSLGASRWRIASQMAVESLVLALASGAAGIFLTWLAIGVMKYFAPPDLYQLAGVRLDWRVTAATLSIALCAGLVAALVPAVQGSRADLVQVLRIAGQTGANRGAGPRWRAFLVTSQIALAVLLLSAGGLLFRSLMNLSHVELGFEAANLGTMRLGLPRTTYPRSQDIAAFWNSALEQVGALPGVQHVAFGFQPPFTPGSSTTLFRVRGRELSDARMHADALRISPDYFTTTRIPLLRGRFFFPSEMRVGTTMAEGSPVIIDQALADSLRVTGDALGASVGRSQSGPWSTVVGIVGTVKTQDLTREPPGTIYFPTYNREATLIFRSDDSSIDLVPLVRQAVAKVDPSQAIFDVRSMEQRVAASLAGRQFLTVILAVFSCLALTLSFIGLSSLVSHAVSQRTSEIGIRMSLGAQRVDILTLTVGWGLRLALLGTVIGTAGALVAGWWLRGSLFGVSAHDPTTFGAVAALLMSTAAVAAYLPSHRAVTMDPAKALAQR